MLYAAIPQKSDTFVIIYDIKARHFEEIKIFPFYNTPLFPFFQQKSVICHNCCFVIFVDFPIAQHSLCLYNENKRG